MKTRKSDLVDFVHRRLCKQLADGELRIGQHVKAQRVARELNVSAATARKAIGQLVRDGWLATGENGRPVVVKIPPRPQLDGDESFAGLTESVSDRIVEMALDREFELGEIIKAKPLAKKLDVSLATLRAALDWLCKDGMLTRLPRRGWQITALTLEEVRTMFTVRRTLEPMALKKLFERIDDEVIDELLAETEQIIADFDRVSRAERLRAERRFHQSLIDMADDAVLSEVLSPLVKKMMLVISVTHGLSRSSWPEHKRILLAIKARDFDKALECLERDLADPLEVAFYDWD